MLSLGSLLQLLAAFLCPAWLVSRLQAAQLAPWRHPQTLRYVCSCDNSALLAAALCQSSCSEVDSQAEAAALHSLAAHVTEGGPCWREVL